MLYVITLSAGFQMLCSGCEVLRNSPSFLSENVCPNNVGFSRYPRYPTTGA